MLVTLALSTWSCHLASDTPAHILSSREWILELECCFAAKNPAQIHKILFQKLDQVLRRYQPRHTFLLAMDGPAPLAKLLTQRCAPLSLLPVLFQGISAGRSRLPKGTLVRGVIIATSQVMYSSWKR